jgi:hypothetical protein
MCSRPVYRAKVLAFLVVGVMFLLSAEAGANIDPASDVLLAQNVFFPYRPEVCFELQEPLSDLTAEAAQAGYPIKVAIIGSQADLGGAAQYFGRPQEYAQLLGNELGFNPHGAGGVEASRSLLTVMPQGFGYYASGDAPDVSEVVDGLDTPESAHPNDLARAAVAALPKMAEAAGHSVAVPSIDSDCPGNGGSSLAVIVVPIGLILVSAGLIAFVARLRRSGER